MRDCCNEPICNCHCVDGPQGPQGLNGERGDNGGQGVQGEQGIIGEQGIVGEQGIQGEQGNQGAPGADGIGTIGDQGPLGNQGQQGPQGIDGDDGNDGVDGSPGFDDTCSPQITISPTGYAPVNYVGATTTVEPNWVPVSSPSFCGSYLMPSHTGPGYILYSFPGSAVFQVGHRMFVYGRRNTGKWQIGFPAPYQIEMSAFNSTVDNRTINAGPDLTSPWWAYGGRVMTIEASGGSNCIEAVYSGDNLWVVVSANLADDILPIFT